MADKQINALVELSTPSGSDLSSGTADIRFTLTYEI